MRPRELMRSELSLIDRPAHGGEGWRWGTVEDFSANLNPLGPPEGLQDVIRAASDGLDHYPDDTCAEFKEALASHYSLGTENFLAGAGSSEIIRLFAEVFIDKGDMAVIPRPTFMEYSFACKLMGGKIVPFVLNNGSYYIDVDVLLKTIGSGVKAVYLCTPNNPTGVATRRADILRLSKALEEMGVLLFLDETLLELMPEETDLTCVREVRSHPNLLIIRSLTKSFAVPGLRSGYAVAQEEMISCLERGRQSWNLGTIEQKASAWLVRYCQGHLRRAAEILRAEKEKVYAHLRNDLGMELHRPDAFFFFINVGQAGYDGASFRKQMLRHGVMVRDCGSFGSPFESYVRFCVKTPEKDEALIRALDLSLKAKG